MKNIYISEEIKELCPNIVLGCSQSEIAVRDTGENLNSEITNYCNTMRGEMVVGDISKQKNIKDTRKAYRSLGKDPTRYRSSAEALARRVIKGQDLYRINNIVEINNLISLKSLYPVCAYDLSKIQGNINLVRAEKGAVFSAIGRGQLNIEYLPVFSDELGYFGSTTSDSVRGMIDKSTKDLLMIIVSFNGKTVLERYMEEMNSLLREFASAKNIKTKFID